MKTVTIYEPQPNNYPYFKCPNCGGENIEKGFQQCPDCGAQLIWKEREMPTLKEMGVSDERSGIL